MGAHRGRDVKGHDGGEEVWKGNKREISLAIYERNKWLEISKKSNETRLVALSASSPFPQTTSNEKRQINGDITCRKCSFLTLMVTCIVIKSRP